MLADQTLVVHRGPVGGRYDVAQVLRAGDAVALAAAPDVAVDVGALFRAQL